MKLFPLSSYFLPSLLLARSCYRKLVCILQCVCVCVCVSPHCLKNVFFSCHKWLKWHITTFFFTQHCFLDLAMMINTVQIHWSRSFIVIVCNSFISKYHNRSWSCFWFFFMINNIAINLCPYAHAHKFL